MQSRHLGGAAPRGGAATAQLLLLFALACCAAPSDAKSPLKVPANQLCQRIL